MVPTVADQRIDSGSAPEAGVPATAHPFEGANRSRDYPGREDYSGQEDMAGGHVRDAVHGAPPAPAAHLAADLWSSGPSATPDWLTESVADAGANTASGGGAGDVALRGARATVEQVGSNPTGDAAEGDDTATKATPSVGGTATKAAPSVGGDAADLFGMSDGDKLAPATQGCTEGEEEETHGMGGTPATNPPEDGTRGGVQGPMEDAAGARNRNAATHRGTAAHQFAGDAQVLFGGDTDSAGGMESGLGGLVCAVSAPEAHANPPSGPECAEDVPYDAEDQPEGLFQKETQYGEHPYDAEDRPEELFEAEVQYGEHPYDAEDQPGELFGGEAPMGGHPYDAEDQPEGLPTTERTNQESCFNPETITEGSPTMGRTSRGNYFKKSINMARSPTTKKTNRESYSKGKSNMEGSPTVQRTGRGNFLKERPSSLTVRRTSQRGCSKEKPNLESSPTTEKTNRESYSKGKSNMEGSPMHNALGSRGGDSAAAHAVREAEKAEHPFQQGDDNTGALFPQDDNTDIFSADARRGGPVADERRHVDPFSLPRDTQRTQDDERTLSSRPESPRPRNDVTEESDTSRAPPSAFVLESTPTRGDGRHARHGDGHGGGTEAWEAAGDSVAEMAPLGTTGRRGEERGAGWDAAAGGNVEKVHEENASLRRTVAQLQEELAQRPTSSAAVADAHKQVRVLEAHVAEEAARANLLQRRILDLEADVRKREERGDGALRTAGDARLGTDPRLPPARPGRAHRRSVTAAHVSGARLAPLAEYEEIRAPRQAPARTPPHREPPRGEPIPTEQRHRRRESLQMLRARMDEAAGAERGSAPLVPTRTLSVVEHGDGLAATRVQDGASRTQPEQFSHDALLFCSTCRGDLMVV
ncbi:hypothetical protein MSPP1_000375 [Malassezia sp. CBS 17886]|nr:hypothetical protein MSPP1_000375 [Malassezia sp. CBS 17886]